MKEIPVIWLQGATCSGCSVTVLNSVAPDVRKLLVDPVLPGVHVNLRFQATIMGGTGHLAVEAMEGTAKQKKGGYVLIVEGSVPTAAGGAYCTIGERGGSEVTFVERVRELAKDALAVISLGTCASYGGIFAAEPNPTGCQGVAQVLKEAGIRTPVVHVPGCPPHPDWFTTTVVTVLLKGIPEASDLDEVGRLKSVYGPLIHENCPRRPYFDAGKFARRLSDEGCLYDVGCKGPQTNADCPLRQWNGGVNWCIRAGGPCLACVEPEFPDKVSPLFEKIDDVRLERFKVKTH